MECAPDVGQRNLLILLSCCAPPLGTTRKSYSHFNGDWVASP
jgi:hypothetical protein